MLAMPYTIILSMFFRANFPCGVSIYLSTHFLSWQIHQSLARLAVQAPSYSIILREVARGKGVGAVQRGELAKLCQSANNYTDYRDPLRKSDQFLYTVQVKIPGAGPASASTRNWSHKGKILKREL